MDTQNTSPAASHMLRGVVSDIRYQNEDGFTIATFKSHGQLLPVRLVGSLIGLSAGMELLKAMMCSIYRGAR